MPGIQTPFVNVGSPLSPFGLHVEDGYSNAVNYLHYGSPKIWLVELMRDILAYS